MHGGRSGGKHGGSCGDDTVVGVAVSTVAVVVTSRW